MPYSTSWRPQGRSLALPGLAEPGPEPSHGRHHGRRLQRSATLAALLGVTVIGAVGCGSSGKSTSSGTRAGSSQTQTITDATGRAVKVPVNIHRIVMVGAPPDIDGFVFAVGDQSLIVNGVPKPFSAAHFGWKTLAPQLVNLPNVESDIEAPIDREALLALKPDVVFTNDPVMAREVQGLGVPAVCITQEGPGTGQERAAATLVGQILHKQQAAAGYVAYFDKIATLVKQRTASVPAAQRPSALYLATRPFRRNGPAMEWLLRYVGARDVAGTVPPVTQFTPEQILRWNPDFIIAHDPTDVPVITGNTTLRSLKAVKSGHVKAIPQDLNEWGDFGVGDALSLLWTAKYLYPKQFADINMFTRAKAFYAQFFHANLSDSQLNEILYGIGGSKVNFGA